MFGSLGIPELILILAVALIVFGPRKLPEIGRTLGKALGEFRKATDDLKSTIEREVRMEELKSITPSIVTPLESISRSGPFGASAPHETETTAAASPAAASADDAPGTVIPPFGDTPAETAETVDLTAETATPNPARPDPA